VVLMMENRSFDNLLGWLYDPANPAPFNQLPPANFEGLYGKRLFNPGPNGVAVPVAKGSDPTQPLPDPGEPYQDVYCQLYNVSPVPALDQVPPNPAQPPAMLGFVNNYAAQPMVTDPSMIMNCFTPATVPVLSSLAYYYGVCDHWFCSIPSQTICNRSYAQAGTSSGYVNNDGGDGVIFLNKTPTIYNLLENSGKSWAVYSASWLITSLVLLTQEPVWEYAVTHHFGHLDDFLTAAKQPGGLPSYSFIEPVYIDSLRWGTENDMHPEANAVHFYGPSNLEKGEALLSTVYQAVRNSPDWNSTLLIILFDEHGGCYDHVPPPSSAECPFAISPDDVVIPPGQKGASGFQFNRLGVRVPAIIVSPYTPQQALLNDTFDHTSLLSTVVNCFDLPKGQLGKRQALAPDVSRALTLPSPRTDSPPVPQPSSSILKELQSEVSAVFHSALRDLKTKSLNPLQKTILTGAAQRLGKLDVQTHRLASIESVLQADAFLMEREADLLAAGFFRSL
jgi:phospholipase C